MPTRPAIITHLFVFQKYIAIILICIGVLSLLLGKPQENLLVSGLFFLFIVPAKPEDERSISLKTSSLYAAFLLSYAVNIAVAGFFKHSGTMDVNQFLILVFSLSLIFYYIRFYSFR